MVHGQDSLVHQQDQEKDAQVQEARVAYKTDEVEEVEVPLEAEVVVVWVNLLVVSGVELKVSVEDVGVSNQEGLHQIKKKH